ncbi:MAG: alpha-1,4-glucan--maltose-1-phosphate maltosyltransferase [Verrucomicrobia bacterium]|nr:alpha-1,4-glucan--maltose-1-phosphate maltosyltransferase [Verrucomicrobiota bacterium]
MSPRPHSCVIENLQPLVSSGRYPVKRSTGESLVVIADIYKDGHDCLRALLKWRPVGDLPWNESPMIPHPQQPFLYTGTFTPTKNALHEFTVEAWGDTFLSWHHEFSVKSTAQIPDLTCEIEEGARLLDAASTLASSLHAKADATQLLAYAKTIRKNSPAEILTLSQSPEFLALIEKYPDRSHSTTYLLNLPAIQLLVDPALTNLPPVKPSKSLKKTSAPPPPLPFQPEYPRLYVDRPQALFSQWYEFFPRSAEGKEDRGSTFRDCLPRIDDAQSMGFDVIYFPPIHPIGFTARKGKNNAVTSQTGEPGVPYAIGNRHQNCPNGGGHKDVAPELGTLEDLDWLIKEIHSRGMELALDFAINCSPDHPYVQDHPHWFYQRPDGSIKYAENPPKKYQDVYPLNFHNPDWPALWSELASIVEFWATRGVRIFRVDNPHTKPVAFWEYLIQRVQRHFPDTLFLSEAFTHPKMIETLANAGFSQSYTYFSWRNSKQSLTDYFNELTHSKLAEVNRPHLWPTTPDILPAFLQFGGRPAFLIRAVLAATLSPIYGIYSGFELCENLGLAKKPWNAPDHLEEFLSLCDNDYSQLAREEYLDSEKYQWKARDWNAQGNLKEFFKTLNRIRRENPALQQLKNLHFENADHHLIIAFSKVTAYRDNVLLIIVSLDPFHEQTSWVDLPRDPWHPEESQTFSLHDLLQNQSYERTGPRIWVKLTPENPAHIFQITRPNP